ncbi:MAG: acyl--CoA ligase [Gammaproteobacteria bacterium]|nr:acyl--CoA ligase [Gammaproteobacteria bacterium]
MSETESHPLKHWLDSIADTSPNAPAIYIENEEIDYLSLKNQVDALVTTLTQAGIKSGNHLALITDSARIIALIAYAAPHMGITFLPLDPRMPTSWLNTVLSQANIDHVLCDNDISNQWESNVNVITIGQLLLQQFSLVAMNAEPATSIYTPLMLATSGSTDIPKVVLLSPENISASVQTTNAHLNLQANDIWLNCLPLFHIAGLMILYRSIACGATVILHEKFSVEKILADMHEHAITHISLVPTMLSKLLDQAVDSPLPGALKAVLIGGAPLDPELAQRAIQKGWPLYMTYGMTETTSQIASTPLNLSDLDTNNPIPIKLYENIEVQIRDEQGQAGADIGHIALRGPQVMVGYAKAEGLGLDSEGWLLTNDIGTVDIDRNLTVLGRADDVIISGGEKILPAQVEAIMMSCPGVDEIVIAGQSDKVWGNIIMAIYSGTFSESQLEQWSEQELKNSWKPRVFKRMEKLPRLTNGKLDRKVLKTTQ